ncbi:MAG: transglycosylase SLT domain-containing protein [Gemmatimonadota bacterium]
MAFRYFCTLMRSVLNIKPMREWPVRPALVLPAGVLATALLFAAFRAPGAIGSSADFRNRTPTDLLILRTAQVSHAFERVDHVYEAEVEPLARVLMEYRADERLANRVATALVREARRTGLSPDLLVAVLLVENPWIDPSARSPVGARGLMQVMPGHRGNWKPCPVSLDGIESNICYGAQIFRAYLRSERGDVERALLRYNGCVRGTNTPNCHEYPSAVFAHVNRAKRLARRPAAVQVSSD